MRYSEFLTMIEGLAGVVVKVARARHEELALAERPSVREVADEAIRALALKVAVELAAEGGERRG